MRAPVLKVMIVLASSVAFLGTGCGDDDDASPKCASFVDPSLLASPTGNTVTVPGTIDSDESVLLRFKLEGSSGLESTVAGTQKGSLIEFKNIPTGRVSMEVVVSCDEADLGQEIRGSRTITVK